MWNGGNVITNKFSDDLWDISDIPFGTIVKDWFEEGVRVIILRSRFSLNVYLGVPSTHPLAGFDYDALPINCHGGLTYSKEGNSDPLPKDYYWYGYDYSHSGDYSFIEIKKGQMFKNRGDKQWTIKEIVDDAWDAIYEMKKLMVLAENIFNKAKENENKI